ncbi:MAG: HAD hydrolase family protein [Chitinophagaceae bacterium]|nr:HAD hydrolase family protein [Chitinophagaceae bacterium]
MNLLSCFQPIRAFIFDVDGVLTDGTILILPDGVEARRMHIRDGFALQMAVKKGYCVKIISGNESAEVLYRLEKLGIRDVTMSVSDKAGLVRNYLKQKNLSQEELLYMGDDLPDIQAMQLAGLPCCPFDAAPEVRDVARYISPFCGGNACVRDVIEKTLRVQRRWVL